MLNARITPYTTNNVNRRSKHFQSHYGYLLLHPRHNIFHRGLNHRMISSPPAHRKNFLPKRNIAPCHRSDKGQTYEPIHILVKFIPILDLSNFFRSAIPHVPIYQFRPSETHLRIRGPFTMLFIGTYYSLIYLHRFIPKVLCESKPQAYSSIVPFLR